MSDDLIKQYEDSEDFSVGCYNNDCAVLPHVWLKQRSEALTRTWNGRRKFAPVVIHQVDEGRIEAAEAKLAKAVEVLQLYAGGVTSAVYARTALAELEGKK